MKLKPYSLKFREPKEEEFGAKFCKGKIFYLSVNNEEKDLPWFFGQEDLQVKTLWKNNFTTNDAFEEIATDFPIKLTKRTKDGTFDSDELEIPYTSLIDITGVTDQVHLSGLDKLFSYMEQQTSSHYLVITKELTCKDFVNEIKSNMKIKSLAEFSSLIDWLTTKRYDRDNFANKKETLKLFTKNKLAIRSIAAFDSIVCDIWMEKLRTVGIDNNTAIKLEDLIELYDTEIADKFYEQNKSCEYIDERELLFNAANYKHKRITKDSVLYYGEPLISDSITNNIMLFNKSHYRGTSKNLLIKINSDYNTFSLCATGAIHLDKATKINKGWRANYGNKLGSYEVSPISSIELIDSIKTHPIFINNEEELGSLININIEHIDLIKTLCLNSETNVFVVPVANSTKFDDVYSKLEEVISSVTIDEIKTIEYNVIDAQIPSMTHLELGTEEKAITAFLSTDPNLKIQYDILKRKGSINDKKENLSEVLEYVFHKMQPLLHAFNLFTLGCDTDMTRPYFLVNRNMGIPMAYDNNGFKDLLFLKNNSRTLNNTFSANLKMFVMFAHLYNHYKDWPKLREDLKNVKLKLLLNKTTITFLIGQFGNIIIPNKSCLIESICELYYSHIEQGVQLCNKSKFIVPTVIVVDGISYDLAELIPNHILKILLYVDMETHIESSVFFNTSPVIKSYFRPKDIILNLLTDMTSETYVLTRSKYANRTKKEENPVRCNAGNSENSTAKTP